MNMLLNTKAYSARRGAAYGLGAVVKGLGVVVMKKYEVREALLEAMQDKVRMYRNTAPSFAADALLRSKRSVKAR